MNDLVKNLHQIDFLINLGKSLWPALIIPLIRRAITRIWYDYSFETPKKLGIGIAASSVSGLAKWQNLVSKSLESQKTLDSNTEGLENAQKRIATYISWVDQVTSIPFRNNNLYKKLINLDIWWICNPTSSKLPFIRRGLLPTIGAFLSIILVSIIIVVGSMLILILAWNGGSPCIIALICLMLSIYAFMFYVTPLYILNEAKDAFDCCFAAAVALRIKGIPISNMTIKLDESSLFLRGAIYNRRLRSSILLVPNWINITAYPAWAMVVTAPLLRHLFKKHIIARSSKIYRMEVYID